MNHMTARIEYAYGQEMGFKEDFEAGIRRMAASRFRNASHYAEEAGVQQGSLSRFLNQKAGLTLDAVGKLLDKVGARIVWPDEKTETTRDICWVDAKVVPAGEGQPLPPSEAYFAVPLVGEAGAGPGVMPTDEIKSWVLVYRHQHAVRFKRNLLAVEIEKGSTSMVPLLRPGDIVLVDRDDCDPGKPGGIFLVREPGQEGGAMVKRVATKVVDHDLLITFYSENAAENPADTFSLKADYNNRIQDAIVGRCVWAWSDITGK